MTEFKSSQFIVEEMKKCLKDNNISLLEKLKKYHLSAMVDFYEDEELVNNRKLFITNLVRNDLFSQETFDRLEKTLKANKGDKIKIINYGYLISCTKEVYDKSPVYPIYRQYLATNMKEENKVYTDYDCKPELVGKEFEVEKQLGLYVWTTTGETFNINQIEKIN